MFIKHRPTLTVKLHNFDLFRTCRTSSFCAVAWQLARFQLTRRIVRSLGDSGASCYIYLRRAGPYTLPCQMSSKSVNPQRRHHDLPVFIIIGADFWKRVYGKNLPTSSSSSSESIFLPALSLPFFHLSLPHLFPSPSIPAFPALHSLCHYPCLFLFFLPLPALPLPSSFRVFPINPATGVWVCCKLPPSGALPNDF